MDKQIVAKAIEQIKVFKVADVDLDNKQMIIPFDKGITEEDVMSECGLGQWFVDNGFDISFVVGDYEYTTKAKFINYRGLVMDKGHKAFLRNRLIATVTW